MLDQERYVDATKVRKKGSDAKKCKPLIELPKKCKTQAAADNRLGR
jgi:hypothetical protein